MIVLRGLGWLLLLAGLMLLGRDLLGWLDTHRLEPLSFRNLWFDLGGSGLAAPPPQIPPLVWDAVLRPALSLWAGPILTVLGLAILAFGPRPRPRARRRRR
jgi:hypothetical protein